MTLNDTTANALSKIDNARKSLYRSVEVKKTKILTQILNALKKNGYVGEFQEIPNSKGNLLNVELLGVINKCGVIKPRFPIKLRDIEKIEKKFLPAKDFGVLLISTNRGLLTQKEIREQHVGGVLIAYCY